jgi:Glycosyl transferases group 1
MRVLHLPSNLASQLSIMVRAQRAIGLDARGIIFNSRPLPTTEGITTFVRTSSDSHSPASQIAKLRRWSTIASSIAWADVIHWHSKEGALPLQMDLKLPSWLSKGRVVEFWGSEVRIPEIACADNPYLARLLAQADGDYHLSYTDSRLLQERFARYAFACLVPGPELEAYVQTDLFPRQYRTEAALNLEDFDPSYPDPTRRKPVVMHAPSNLAVKGTDAVLRAVEQLKTQYDFEFRLLHRVPRSEVLALLRDCDIMLDQFVIGSFGTAALEAMALGKPALCYLTPSVVASLPPDAPFVNANQENLAEILGGLLADGERRQAIGCQSRAYVEAHHDARKVAIRLKGIYQELIERTRRN